MPLQFPGRTSWALLCDEYQNEDSAGSLVEARRCWLELVDADALQILQRFTFVFDCPTELMALGLVAFMRYTAGPGFVRATDSLGVVRARPWQVIGTSPAAVWSLSSLEHLFMRLRGAASRYESVLVTLDLLPVSR